ncbi:methionyl-tRNA formyltransferase [Oenococcus sp. UCMA 16435]|nr:methionyl-tRNA formyltransferase [Oenococcus sp. UCMA 16435]MDI4584210.1 methionyl-tRNA formyltransferase [Oenococcus sp. UCMA 14587]
MTNSVIFFGTSDFSEVVLQGLIDDADFEVVAVVSQPDRPVGRKKILQPTKIKQLALDYKLPIFQPEKLSRSEEMNQLISMQADFLVTAAFGQFVPSKLLKSAKIASINVHASLLPKYRGAAPINWALINGDKETGVSIMYMVKAMDAGDLISTEKILIEENDDAGSLFNKLAVVGRNLLLKTMPKMVSGNISPIQQDKNQITLAPKINHELTELDFYHQKAEKIVNLIRGLSPKPGSSLEIADEKIKIFKAKIGPYQGEIGSISIKSKHDLAITAADGRTVFLQEIQPVGKKIMDVSSFLNGAGKNLHVGDMANRI